MSQRQRAPSRPTLPYVPIDRSLLEFYADGAGRLGLRGQSIEQGGGGRSAPWDVTLDCGGAVAHHEAILSALSRLSHAERALLSECYQDRCTREHWTAYPWDSECERRYGAAAAPCYRLERTISQAEQRAADAARRCVALDLGRKLGAAQLNQIAPGLFVGRAARAVIERNQFELAEALRTERREAQRARSVAEGAKHLLARMPLRVERAHEQYRRARQERVRERARDAASARTEHAARVAQQRQQHRRPMRERAAEQVAAWLRDTFGAGGEA